MTGTNETALRGASTESGHARGENAVQRFSSRTHSITPQRQKQPQPEHYEADKASVTVPDVGRMYGLEINRNGKALCPFHNDHHPSLKLYAERFKCFACGTSGTVIDLAAQLLGLTPADAVRRLNADFGLNLPLEREATPEEALEAKQRRERREFVKDAEARFNKWRDQTLRALTLCLQVADGAEGVPPDELTDEEVLGLRYAPALEWWFDVLNDERDTPERIERQMPVLRRRGEVEAVGRRIWTAWQMRLTNYSR